MTVVTGLRNMLASGVLLILANNAYSACRGGHVVAGLPGQVAPGDDRQVNMIEELL